MAQVYQNHMLKQNQLEESETAMKRATQMVDEHRKKAIQLEVKLKQTTQTTVKDLKKSLKER